MPFNEYIDLGHCCGTLSGSSQGETRLFGDWYSTYAVHAIQHPQGWRVIDENSVELDKTQTGAKLHLFLRWELRMKLPSLQLKFQWHAILYQALLGQREYRFSGILCMWIFLVASWDCQHWISQASPAISAKRGSVLIQKATLLATGQTRFWIKEPSNWSVIHSTVLKSLNMLTICTNNVLIVLNSPKILMLKKIGEKPHPPASELEKLSVMVCLKFLRSAQK